MKRSRQGLIASVVAGVACVCSCGHAAAAVYRCQLDGKTVYTDQPCKPGAAAAALPELQSMPATKTDGDVLEHYDARRASEQAARAQARAEWSARHRAQRAQEKAVRQGLVEGRVTPGMTPAQVQSVLGAPTRRSGRNGHPHRWMYRNGRERTTVDFKDGVVVGSRSSHRR